MIFRHQSILNLLVLKVKTLYFFDYCPQLCGKALLGLSDVVQTFDIIFALSVDSQLVSSDLVHLLIQSVTNTREYLTHIITTRALDFLATV